MSTRRAKDDQQAATVGDVRRAVEKSEMKTGVALMDEMREFSEDIDARLTAFADLMEDRWIEKAHELHQLAIDARHARSSTWRRVLAWRPW